MTLFPPKREALVNYDWIDVADAVGYIQYDGYKSVDSVGINRSLVRSSNATPILYSISSYEDSGGDNKPNQPHFIEVGISDDSATFIKFTDIDFDLSEFQLPRILKGTAYLKLNSIAKMSGGDNFSVYIIARLKKNDVEIVSVQSTTIVNSSASNLLKMWESLEITIPQTHFKKGDFVRLTLEAWGRNDAAGANTLQIGFAGDPQDREDTFPGTAGATGALSAGETRIILALPFKMEI